ncbi:MAG: hypothetical protein DVB26_01190 [Verrucomicrobia bacterium]|nr:MAG: hypothetical protein DVB26_01190 [Verrucomicrobiota bacterium]
MSDDILPDLLAAVEQQLASPQTRYVAATLVRLEKIGLAMAEAKDQIALCLGEAMDEVLRRHRAFDEPAYRAALDALPFPDDEAEEDQEGAMPLAQAQLAGLASEPLGSLPAVLLDAADGNG